MNERVNKLQTIDKLPNQPAICKRNHSVILSRSKSQKQMERKNERPTQIDF